MFRSSHRLTYLPPVYSLSQSAAIGFLKPKILQREEQLINDALQCSGFRQGDPMRVAPGKTIASVR